MSRPTDASLARAFREMSRRTSIGQPWTLDYFVLMVNKCAERFDAEAGGTDRQTEGVMQIEAVQHVHTHDPVASAADGKAAAPYAPPDGKIACPIPTCRAELLPGQTCGGVNCGLRKASQPDQRSN